MMLWLFCVLSSLVDPLSAFDEQTITAVPGQDSVTLPCGAGEETQIKAVRWFRPDLHPGYVLVFRDDQLYLDDQNPSFRNRVDLQDRQRKDGDVSLILKDVTTDDTGTYLCTVIQGGGNRRKRSVTETSIHLVVSPPGRGHLALVLVLVLVASVLGIVAVIAAVLIRKRKTPPPPPEGAAVILLVQTQSSDNSPPPPEGAPVQPLV